MRETIAEQRHRLDSLLKNPAFALYIAKSQDTAYYAGIGQPVPPFLSAEEEKSVLKKLWIEEQQAVSLTPFYALECGLGTLCKQTEETPVTWLQRIVANRADSNAVHLLQRFANATWKAAQPFQSLNNIQRATFTVAGLCAPDQLDNEYFLVKTAAGKLLDTLQHRKDSSTEKQLEKNTGITAQPVVCK